MNLTIKPIVKKKNPARKKRIKCLPVLQEDQQKRLIASVKTGKYARLDEDESIQDIYDGVLLQFLDDERAALDPEIIVDYFDLESEDDVTDEVIDEYMDDFYGAALSIYYPAELLN